ncbi:hypothetical protein FJTKL_11943 [Diaporthe vaccinii]|uniref:Uncharacterized protein n=1 Tax=Diaporthe vaccinii TaxID=105482 RepID=A0ABR4FB55_9PEZI
MSQHQPQPQPQRLLGQVIDEDHHDLDQFYSDHEMTHGSVCMIVTVSQPTSAKIQESTQTQTEKKQTNIAYRIHRGQQCAAITPRIYTCWPSTDSPSHSSFHAYMHTRETS